MPMANGGQPSLAETGYRAPIFLQRPICKPSELPRLP